MANLDTNNWVDWKELEWRQWLERQIDVRKQIFLSDPDEMIAAYNRERSSARDYYGRELLELLQNADDAGAEIDQKNSVLIDVQGNSLYVANTGQPFSPAGVKSLMVSDNSPKQLSRTRFIGYKGLGFRSVLGWASKIVILSGKLFIGYTEDYAIETAKSICNKNNQAQSLVDKFIQKTGSFPVPTLAFPIWIDDGDNFDDEFRGLVERARDIGSHGFDTVICFAMRDPEKTKQAVESQINSLGKEVLLFSHYLEKAEVKSSNRNVVWNATREENQILVKSNTEDSSSWQVFHRNGDMPTEFIGPGQSKEIAYEVKIAVPSIDADPHNLFVYFPTQVSFPFPLIAHATFELGGNRQNLIESDTNRFVSNQLAGLMAEVSETITDTEDHWKAISIITPRGQIDPLLIKLGFKQMLIEKCSGKKIVPVRKRKFYTPAQAKSINGDFDELLHGNAFHDLCLWTDDYDLQDQLQTLGVEDIDLEELKARIDGISPSLPVKKRAKLIFLLLQNDLLIENSVPTLLIDDAGDLVPESISVFLPPEGKPFSIPKWVPIRFLNPKLTKGHNMNSALREFVIVNRQRKWHSFRV